MKLEDYAIRIEPLPREEGGGLLLTVPDLPGCVADGDTVDAAIAAQREGPASGQLLAWPVHATMTTKDVRELDEELQGFARLAS